MNLLKEIDNYIDYRYNHNVEGDCIYVPCKFHMDRTKDYVSMNKTRQNAQQS